MQLAEVEGKLVYETPSDVHSRVCSPLLAPSDDIDCFVDAMRDPDYLRFCFVRNPFTRVLSCYLDKMVRVEFERRRLAPKLGFDPEKVPSFIDFLRAVVEQKDEECDIHWTSQTYLLRPNRVRYSFIGRFELFGEQLTMVCKKLSILQYNDPAASWHATNAYKKVKEYIGREEIDLIHRIYVCDFRNFSYGWSPELI